jgi:hypothetical protein
MTEGENPADNDPQKRCSSCRYYNQCVRFYNQHKGNDSDSVHDSEYEYVYPDRKACSEHQFAVPGTGDERQC